MNESSIFALFLAGLLGGGHCVGMCGGLTTALSLHLPNDRPNWPYLLCANLGRMTAYVLLGTLAGAAGQLSVTGMEGWPVQITLYIFANILMFLLGLYLAGLSSAVAKIETLGRPIWRRLQPLMRKFIPIRSLKGAYAAGLLWGWIPCGLVYTAMLSALSSGHIYQGSAMMFAFWLGTLPNLMLMGLFAEHLKSWVQHPWIRRLAGLTLCVLALKQLFAALS